MQERFAIRTVSDPATGVVVFEGDPGNLELRVVVRGAGVQIAIDDAIARSLGLALIIASRREALPTVTPRRELLT